jgi:ATP-binding cassette subfamily B protein
MQSRYSDWVLLKRMMRQGRPFWPHVTGIFLLSLLSTPVALLTPMPLKIVIDSVIGSRPLPGILHWLVPAPVQQSPSLLLLFAVGLLVAVTLLTYVQGSGSWLLQTYAGEGMVLDFRGRLFAHVQRLSLAYHDLKGTSDSTFRIQNDAPSVQFVTVNGIIPLIATFATLISMIYVTARLDWVLAIVALAVSPVMFVLTHVFRKRLRDRWSGVKELESSANSVVQEVLSSMRVVKAFGREEHEHARFLHRSARRMRELLRVSLLQGGFDLLIGATIGIGSAATLYIGVLHVRAGILTLGDLTLITAYIVQLYEPLKAVSKKLADLQGALSSAERAFLLLDQAPDVGERPHPKPIVRAKGAVRFEDVFFAYDGRHPVIEGPSGAGKSTLLSLLTRFYDVSCGRVLLDGVDLRDYKLADLRRQFAIVLQESVLFSTSIEENIAYGRPDATEEQIIQAAKLANAHEFIAKLTNGYDTVVGERGMQLSGGERQRISLARAFLKDAPILILDEPTSAMDGGTEALVFEALERLMEGRTTFMIAHRLSTLESCDVRLELRAGRLSRVQQVDETILSSATELYALSQRLNPLWTGASNLPNRPAL